MVNRRIIDQTEALSLSGDDYLVADNANLGTRKIQFTRLLSGATPLPPDYITGFEIVKMANTKISISRGYARSSDNLRNIQLSTSLIKDISATFDLGNNAGCMTSGLTLQASSKYFIFVISTSGGQTDIIVDTNENCSNGLVDNVVVSNNFDKFVCVGSITTDANSQVFIINSYIENFPKNYKSTITSWGIPDYSAKISLSYNMFPYTAPTDGVVRINEQINNGIPIVYVNNVSVWSQNDNGDYKSCEVYVAKGDVVTIANTSAIGSTSGFFPLKGVNK